MQSFIENPGKAKLIPATLLTASLMIPAKALAQDEQTASATTRETHALIEELILDKPILQNYWHKLDFPQYNHFDDAVWTVVMYEGDECEITYRRTIEVTHKPPATDKPFPGDKPETIIGHKTMKFDLAEVEAIEIHDYDDSRGSMPSLGIRIVGPAEKWQTIGRKPKKKDLSKDPVLTQENAISVLAKDAQQVLKSLQHLQGTCQTADQDQS
jgi:hypothetical protein